MKNLVVYYSRTTNTETVAREISKAVNGEIKKIQLTKEIGFGWAGFTAALGLKAKIKPIDFNVKGYDNIFIGSPLWAGKSSTPINTFLNEADFKGKNVFILITQADSKSPTSVFQSIKARVEAKGGKVIDNLFIQTNMKKLITSDEAAGAVSDWIDKNRVFFG